MRIGIDLGGTKIEAAALDARGRILLRRRSATPRDYLGTIQAVNHLVVEMETALNAQAKVGIGTPGAPSPATGLIKNANSTWLIGKAFQADLESALRRPVRLANDANCFALSKARDGAGAEAEVVFGAIVGTGTGGGIVVRGHLLTGPNAVAGEWGHNPLPWPRGVEYPGPACYCGKTGCIETFLSGPGLAADHQKVTGISMTPEQIAGSAEAGDAPAEAALQRYEDRMARALASAINVLDPDVIVLGGGMSNLKRLYENVPRAWTGYVFSDRVDTRLVPPRFGDSSGVRGAAWLWPVEE